MPSVVTLVLLALAVTKGTWLVVDAAVTMPLRQWVVKRFGAEGKLAYLVHCPGCSAVWVATGLTTVTFLTEHLLWVGFLTMLAAAQVAPMIMSLADRFMAGDG